MNDALLALSDTDTALVRTVEKLGNMLIELQKRVARCEAELAELRGPSPGDPQKTATTEKYPSGS